MPGKQSEPVEYLHIHLLKKEIKDPSEAIKDDKEPDSARPVRGILEGGSLYFETPPANPVPWREFLAPGFGPALPRFTSKHTSAVLFVPAGGRVFALTFGYGRSLLNDSTLEADFGLRTGVNLCDPDTLRAVDYRTIEERTRIGRVQLSDEGSVGAFRMDVHTDLLRGLEARSKDLSICHRFGARWSNLTVATKTRLRDLPSLVTKLLRLYAKRKLPKEYEWIDNVRRILDPSKLDALDRELESRLDNNIHDRIRLALPEIASEGIQLDAHYFNPDGPVFESRVASYLDQRPRDTESTVRSAKLNHKVVLIDSATSKVRQAVSVYQCLVAELEWQEGLYLLADGEWFSLDRDYVSDVNGVLRGIDVLQHALPAWNPGEHESSWNERACRQWPHAALLDKGNLQHGGSHSKIEPADLLTRSRVIGHVKRRDKNSSGLSHLFAQGSVSAELISQDRTFRDKVANELPGTHRQLAAELRRPSFNPQPWTVAFILLGADAVSPAMGLPFFSKVNLRRHAERLRAMQFGVGLIGV